MLNSYSMKQEGKWLLPIIDYKHDENRTARLSAVAASADAVPLFAMFTVSMAHQVLHRIATPLTPHTSIAFAQPTISSQHIISKLAPSHYDTLLTCCSQMLTRSMRKLSLGIDRDRH